MKGFRSPPMLDTDDLAFFGRTLEKFQDAILRQSETVFDQAGLVVPPRSCSLILAIRNNEEVSASDLSQILGYSHQRVLQKIPKLRKLNLIRVRQDREDARRRIFELTKQGNFQAELLEQVLPAFASAYRGLFDEIGDIERLVSDALNAIEHRPLAERIELPRRRAS